MSKFRLPGKHEKTVIAGRTGTGKTQFGIWLLSMQDLRTTAWIIIDYKRDELVNAIERAQDITFSDDIPTKPGVYILRVSNGQDEELTEFLWKLWRHATDGGEGVGLMVDEGLMLGQYNRAFNTLQQQGRSLEIPIITLTQKPVDVSTWALSEADFWVVFDLVRLRDRKKVAEDVPIPVNYNLPRFHSYVFDVKQRRLEMFGPVPDEETILETIDRKLPKNRRRTI